MNGNKQRLNTEDILKVYYLTEDGMTAQQIAEETGIRPGSIGGCRYYLRKHLTGQTKNKGRSSYRAAARKIRNGNVTPTPTREIKVQGNQTQVSMPKAAYYKRLDKALASFQSEVIACVEGIVKENITQTLNKNQKLNNRVEALEKELKAKEEQPKTSWGESLARRFTGPTLSQ